MKLIKYALYDEVWHQRKTFGKNENKKMAPRKTGPWKIIKVYPNGVNFKIEDKNSNKRLIAHHNRLSPVTARDNGVGEPTSITFDESDSDSEGNLPLTSEEETNDEYMQAPTIGRAYPKRIRKQRVIPNAIPWDTLDI